MAGKSQSYWGSIDLTTILRQAALPHSAFIRAGKENKAFINVTVWVNEEPDQYGNSISIKLKSRDEELQKAEGNVYIANLKKSEAKPAAPLEADAADIPGADNDGLPF